MDGSEADGSSRDSLNTSKGSSSKSTKTKSKSPSQDAISLKVAVRVRPLSFKELNQDCQQILSVLKSDNSIFFTPTSTQYSYDHVLSTDSTQDECFEIARPFIDNFLDGYNTTILAYGQTGSGKTFTMGTGFSIDSNKATMGIIPRAVELIFETLNESKAQGKIEFTLKVQFSELYNEEINDLLGGARNCDVTRVNGSIVVDGLEEVPVATPDDVADILKRGSLNRATASTDMNNTSSRSHAIFSLILELKKNLDDNSGASAFISSKFHFVDLAGSERLKKTNATGERAKEGININKALLALGNVISVLGNPNQKKNAFVNYRDSKLTRLLQDSLGGNSLTLMFACASPADFNKNETASTLDYAKRARNIRNKAVVNYNDDADMLTKLQNENFKLRNDLIKAQEQSVMASSLSCHSGDLGKILKENMMVKSQYQNVVSSLITGAEWFNKIIEKNDGHVSGESPELRDAIENIVRLAKTTYEQNNSQKSIKPPPSDISDSQKPNTTNSTSDSFSEMYGNNTSFDETDGEKLAEMTKLLESRISAKEGLISSMHVEADMTEFTQLKTSYEEKIIALEKNLNMTVTQRDNLLQNIMENKESGETKEKVKVLEEKIKQSKSEMDGLKKEVKNMSSQLKRREVNTQKMKELLREVSEMKKQKIKYIKQMRLESTKLHKEKTTQKNEMIKLERNVDKYQLEIAKLKQENKQTKEVLSRKIQESSHVRKSRITHTNSGNKKFQCYNEFRDFMESKKNQYLSSVKRNSTFAQLKEKETKIKWKLKASNDDEDSEYWAAELSYLQMQIEEYKDEDPNEAENMRNDISKCIKNLDTSEVKTFLSKYISEDVLMSHIASKKQEAHNIEQKEEAKHLAQTLAESHARQCHELEKRHAQSIKRNKEQYEQELSKKQKVNKELELKYENLEEKYHNLIQENKKRGRLIDAHKEKNRRKNVQVDSLFSKSSDNQENFPEPLSFKRKYDTGTEENNIGSLSFKRKPPPLDSQAPFSHPLTDSYLSESMDENELRRSARLKKLADNGQLKVMTDLDSSMNEHDLEPSFNPNYI